MAKFSVVCPVCRDTLEFTDTQKVLSGILSVMYPEIAEVTVTNNKVREHMDKHREDGSYYVAVQADDANKLKLYTERVRHGVNENA